MLSPEQESLLARYRELWVDMGAAVSLREAMDVHIRDIRNKQRQLANKIAALEAPEYET